MFKSLHLSILSIFLLFIIHGALAQTTDTEGHLGFVFQRNGMGDLIFHEDGIIIYFINTDTEHAVVIRDLPRQTTLFRKTFVEPITHIALPSDRSQILVGLDHPVLGNIIRAIETVNGERVFERPSAMTDIAYSPNNTSFTSLTPTLLTIWNSQTYKIINDIELDRFENGILQYIDDDRILAVNRVGQALLYTISTGTVTQISFNQPVFDLLLLENSGQLLLASDNSQVLVTDTINFEIINDFSGVHDGVIQNIAHSVLETSSKLFSLGDESELQIWDFELRTPTMLIEHLHDEPIQSISASPEGAWLSVITSEAGYVLRLDSTGEFPPLCEGRTPRDVNARYGPNILYEVAEVLPPGETVIVTGQALNASQERWLRLADNNWVLDRTLRTTGRCDLLPYIYIPEINR